MELPMGSGAKLGLRRGKSKVGPISQPCGTVDIASHTLIRTNAYMCFPNQLYSRQLRVTCTLIYRGAVSHQARECRGTCDNKVN